MAATRIADYYASRVVRVAAAALCLSGLALYAFTFAPWFKHQDYGTPRERFLEDSEGLYLRVSGWEIYGTLLLAALILLAVFVAIGAAAWLVRRPGDRAGLLACLVVLVAAVAALLRIVDELRAPSNSAYPHPVWGIYAALGAAVALVVSSLAAALVAALTGKSRDDVGSVWPLVAAAAVVYALTLVAYDSGVWLPEMILVCPLAGIVGYLVRHWLVAFVPVPLVIVYIQLADVKGLGVFALLYLALLATGAVIAGVAARAIQRRLADTAPALS
jgi:hypothetical protein